MNRPSKLLHGERIRLTALSDDDAATIASWSDDGEFLRLYDTRPAHPRSAEGIAAWLEDLRDDDRTVTFGIRLQQDDALIGTLQLDGIIWAHRVCGLGIALGGRENWGQGYGYEAAHLGLTFAFDELNLHRVTATVFSYNERSVALVQKLGFQREGEFREFLERDGERHDMLLFGLLRPEWRRRNKD